jgi:hypothetical protein
MRNTVTLSEARETAGCPPTWGPSDLKRHALLGDDGTDGKSSCVMSKVQFLANIVSHSNRQITNPGSAISPRQQVNRKKANDLWTHIPAVVT